MTTGEAAATLGVTVPRVRQLVKAGQLKPRSESTARGPLLWFQKTEVEALKAARIETERRRAMKGGKGRPLRGTGVERSEVRREERNRQLDS